MKSLKPKLSIYAMLASMIVLSVFAVLGTHAYIAFKQSKEGLTLQIRQNADKKLSILKESIAGYMESYAVNEYEKLVSAEFEYGSALAIVVEDYNMGRILGTSAYKSGKIRLPNGRIDDFAPDNQRHLKLLKDVFYLSSTEIRGAHNEKLGYLEIYVDDALIKAEFERIMLHAFIDAAVFGLIIVVLLYASINSIILKPLSLMIAAITDKQPNGLPRKLLDSSGSIELNTLSYAINEMIANIEHSHDELQKSEFRWKFAVEGSGDGLWDWNLRTNEVYFSKRWKEMLGFEDHEIQGTLDEWKERVHPEDLEQVYIDIQRHLGGDAAIYSNEHRVLCKDGHYKWILDRGVVVERDEEGKPLRMIGTHTDIEELKKITQELIESRAEAEDANHAKSEFLANMSHEIRTPLGSIIGFTDLLLNTPLSLVQREYLTRSKSASEALLHVINDILDYSKIEARKLMIEEQSFHPCLLWESIADLFAYSAYGKGLEFIFEIDPNLSENIVGDRLRIAQVLNNLVGNSIKFTQEGYIKIIARVEGEMLEISVEDSGIGMNEELQKRLFGAFTQGDSSNSRRYGGSGLGLKISKELVELMGGKMWVQSQEGKGSRFIFTVAYMQGEAPSEDAAPSTLPAGKKVAVVDSHANERLSLATLFKLNGISTSFIESNEASIQKIEEGEFDWIIFDLESLSKNDYSLAPLFSKLCTEAKVLLLATPTLMSSFEHSKIAACENYTVLERPVTPNRLFKLLARESGANSQSEEVKKELQFQGEVLIVDDSSSNRIILSEYLHRYALKTECADNGLEALEMVKRHTYDLILMDLQMPLMDGFAACENMRKMGLQTPIVAVSAAVMQHDKELTKAAGMDGHIAKPIERSELEGVLKAYLSYSYVEKRDEERESAPMEIYGVDMLALQESLNGDVKRISSLLKGFSQSYGSMKVELEALRDSEDEMRSYLHKLKGVSGNLKMRRLYAAAAEAEKQIGSKDFQLYLDTITAQTLAIIDSIEKNLSEASAKYDERLTPQEIAALARSLAQKTENYEYVESASVERLLRALEGKAEALLIETLRDAFVSREREAMLRVLQKIQQGVQDESDDSDRR